MKKREAQRRKAFSGRLISVHIDTLADGSEREIVLHPGAAAVIAADGSQRVVLVQQYRHAAGKDMWEIPAGLLEAGEDPLACAKRELQEEAGYKARAWQYLTAFYSSPGYSTELIHLYRASDLKQTGADVDPAEIGVIDHVSLPVAEAMIRDGRIQDAKTIMAICLLACEQKR